MMHSTHFVIKGYIIGDNNGLITTINHKQIGLCYALYIQILQIYTLFISFKLQMKYLLVNKTNASFKNINIGVV